MLHSQGTLKDLFTIEPETSVVQPKAEAVKEPETEEELPEEPETAGTDDSAEVSSEKPAGGKVSQNLLEQVWLPLEQNLFCPKSDWNNA